MQANSDPTRVREIEVSILVHFYKKVDLLFLTSKENFLNVLGSIPKVDEFFEF